MIVDVGQLKYEIDIDTYDLGRMYKIFVYENMRKIYNYVVYSTELEYYYHDFKAEEFYKNRYFLVQYTLDNRYLIMIEGTSYEKTEKVAALFTEALKEIRKIEKIYKNTEGNLDCYRNLKINT